MEAISPSDPCEIVVLQFSSQVGKTEVLNNTVGFVMEQDPGPCLVVQPNVKPMGEAWSKDRLAPMIRDTPALLSVINDGNKKNSENTILHKKFPGGHLTIGGANSPAGLASRPIRYLLCDEIDRYEKTREGNAVKLASKRTTTFHNRKILLVSSPTYEGVGINAEYESCDQKYEWQLQCEWCKEWQYPSFKHFIFDSKTIRKDRKVQYSCESCGGLHDVNEWKLKSAGRWIQTKNEGDRKKGFWMNQFGSPFVSWADTIVEFLDAGDDPEKLQTVTNTAFAEVYKQAGEGVDSNALYERRENYKKIPQKGLIVVCAVDVQSDRLEIEISAFGRNEENFSVDYRVIRGDPAERSADGRLGRVWSDLDAVINQTFEHESGVSLPISITVIDSGGHHTQEVYEFCKPRTSNRVYPIKGSSNSLAPITSAPSSVKMKNGKKINLYTIGVDRLKAIVQGRLNLEPNTDESVDQIGYYHFPEHYPLEYFKQLAAEEKRSRKQRGETIYYWYRLRKANEAFDLKGYSLFAIRFLNPVWQQWEEWLEHQQHTASQVMKPRKGRRVLSKGV